MSKTLMAQMARVIRVVIFLGCFAHHSLSAQERSGSEVGIHFKRIIPSAFTPTPGYSTVAFPYMSRYQTNGLTLEAQMVYRKSVGEHWGLNIGLGASWYSTGLSVYLPTSEDPNPAGSGVMDFYNSLDGSRTTAMLGVDYVLKARWFDVRPVIGMSFGSHFNEILRLSQGFATDFPVGSGTYRRIFIVFIERNRFIEVNPYGGIHMCFNKFSNLLNFILGIEYVHSNRESLHGYYEIDAVSGSYVGSLSNTEKRLEFLVGVNFKLKKEAKMD